MSDGLKTGLIVAGAAAAAFLLYQRAATPAIGAVAPSGGASPVGGASPGFASSATSSGAPPNGSSRSTLGTIGHYTALAATASFIVPIKTIGFAGSVASKAAGVTYGALKSIGGDIASIF